MQRVCCDVLKSQLSEMRFLHGRCAPRFGSSPTTCQETVVSIRHIVIASLLPLVSVAALAADPAASAPALVAAPHASPTPTEHPLGDHPAVVVQRLHAQQGIDYASTFYPHPAWLYLRTEPQR